MEAITLEKINDDLEFLKKKVAEIEGHIVDLDVILTEDDAESLREADNDLKQGKTKRLI